MPLRAGRSVLVHELVTPKTLVDMSDYEVTVRSLRVLLQRVAPSGRVAPWPDVILTQVYSSLGKRSLQARIWGDAL